VIGQCDLECGIDAFRTIVAKEDAVHACRRDPSQGSGGFKRLGMAHLEGGCEIHERYLLLHCLNDLWMAVACVDAPQARSSIQNLTAVVSGVIHARCRSHQTRLGLVLAIGGERHPQVRGVESFCHEHGAFIK